MSIIFVGRLTYRQRDELKRFACHAVGREAFRPHMVLLSSRGYLVPQIAEIYDCDRDTVRTWLKKYLAKGIDGLRDAVHHLGYRWRRPKLVALKLDSFRDLKLAIIDVFLKAYGSACSVFYMDECHCQLLPNVRSCWMRRGQQKEVITPGTNERVTVYGALNSRTGQWVYSIFAKRAAKNFITFLETLCTQVKTGPILVILDNDRTHKAEVVWEWLEEHPRIHLLWLPKYTPHLNPVETVWRILKARLANYCSMDTGELIWAIEQLFRHGSGVEFELPIAA
ncbi:MAG TPA: IS630 family transposase [Firmicutes bacterium]|nr:IS630 family transposase [Bacillota bacterium]